MAQHDYNLANQNGASFRADLNNALSAILSKNSGAVAPTTTTPYMEWLDTVADRLKIRNAGDSAFVDMMDFVADVVAPISNGVPLNVSEIAFTSLDATPSVQGGRMFVTANAGATTITTFDDPTLGQRITLRINDLNTTIAGALTVSGRAILCLVDDYLEFEYDGANWNQLGGSVGMGNRFVPVDPADLVGDQIGVSVVVFTDIDVTDDGVRQGASAVELATLLNVGVGSGIAYQVRPNGSADSGNGTRVAEGDASINGSQIDTFNAGLDDSGIFEARWSAAWTLGSNIIHVRGYYI